MVIVLNPSPMNANLTQDILDAADWMVLNEIEAMQLTGSTGDGEEELSPRPKFSSTLSACSAVMAKFAPG